MAALSLTTFVARAHAQDPTSSPGTEEPDAQVDENAVLREKVLRLEEQQKTLLERINELQRLFNATEIPATVPPAVTPEGQIVPAMDRLTPRYDDGFVLVKTSEFPFFLKLNNTTQFRYLNTQALDSDTFTDHIGIVHPVAARNDFSINRSLFTFSGYVFDQRLKYGLVTWTSNTLASVVVGGNVSWQFGKGLTLLAGYWTVPGSRTLTYTFPYFTQPDRSMADNFFRPGLTQGIWTTGEPVKGFFHQMFLGNGLNTLAIPTSKIDTNLLFSGSVWWEPLGPYGPVGKPRNMYDDYYPSATPVVRVGTSYTRSREDRFSNLDERNPENTALHNSDGVLTFSTGAFAPGVTLQEATYRMWALDGGVKWNGLAVNAQVLLPLAQRFSGGWTTSAVLHVRQRRRAGRGVFRQSEETGTVRPHVGRLRSVRQFLRVRRRLQVVLRSGSPRVADRGAYSREQLSLRRSPLSVHRRDVRLGASASADLQLLIA